MGLFNKKKGEVNSHPGNMQNLPELPRLPDLPKIPQKQTSANPPAKPNALPRFPSNSLGNKFSQNTIKDAVSGEKEGDVVNEFEHEIQKMPQPSDKSNQKMPAKGNIPPLGEDSPPPKYKNSNIGEMDEEKAPSKGEYSPSLVEQPFHRYSSQKSQADEPVFIRLDKFEDSIDTFNKIKKQVSGVNKLLDEIKSIKEREDKELEDWKAKLEMMKNQIEKIDKDIFSKI